MYFLSITIVLQLHNKNSFLLLSLLQMKIREQDLLFPTEAVVGVCIPCCHCRSIIFIYCYQTVGVVVKLLEPVSILKGNTNKPDIQTRQSIMGKVNCTCSVQECNEHTLNCS